MSVLVFAENIDGQYKKATYEVVNYGKKIAGKIGGEVVVYTTGEADHAALGQYGADKILVDGDSRLSVLDGGAYAKAIAKAAEQSGATVVVFSHSSTGKSLASRVAARMEAGLVPGAVDVPNTDNGFTVKKSVFSGKAFAHYAVQSDKKVISLTPNTFAPQDMSSAGAVESFDNGLSDADFKVKVRERKKPEGGVPLEEAELVVSGGRGLKGPENWSIVENLAEVMGASTACSRPVADSNWRPHHEHVGQTGGTIRPNLYIAIGISGAIQHLAGVNQSKTIVVINKDPEAPFFKAADYGIVGDAFEVVPKLTEAMKAFKAANN